jgi:hypothetical protein
VTEPTLIDSARIGTIITITQTRNIATQQTLTSNYLAFTSAKLLVISIGLIQTNASNALLVGAESIVNSSPEAPAVILVRLTRLQQNITATYTSASNLHIDFLLKVVLDSDGGTGMNKCDQAKTNKQQTAVEQRHTLKNNF